MKKRVGKSSSLGSSQETSKTSKQYVNILSRSKMKHVQLLILKGKEKERERGRERDERGRESGIKKNKRKVYKYNNR